MASFPLVWSDPSYILHCLTRERQTHDADNNECSTNNPFWCRSFTEKLRSHVRARERSELSRRRNMTYRSNPHCEQNENIAEWPEHAHYRSRSTELARLTHRLESVTPCDRRQHHDAHNVTGKVDDERRDGQH